MLSNSSRGGKKLSVNSKVIPRVNLYAAKDDHVKVQSFSPIREDKISRTLICRILFGKRCEEQGSEQRRFEELLTDLRALVTIVFVSDYFPSFSWVDKLSGLINHLNKTFKNMGCAIHGVVRCIKYVNATSIFVWVLQRTVFAVNMVNPVGSMVVRPWCDVEFDAGNYILDRGKLESIRFAQYRDVLEDKDTFKGGGLMRTSM
ncbi:hypothetical protein ACS0TY_017699 [Phlomoides rotata]